MSSSFVVLMTPVTGLMMKPSSVTPPYVTWPLEPTLKHNGQIKINDGSHFESSNKENGANQSNKTVFIVNPKLHKAAGKS